MTMTMLMTMMTTTTARTPIEAMTLRTKVTKRFLLFYLIDYNNFLLLIVDFTLLLYYTIYFALV